MALNKEAVNDLDILFKPKKQVKTPYTVVYYTPSTEPGRVKEWINPQKESDPNEFKKQIEEFINQIYGTQKMTYTRPVRATFIVGSWTATRGLSFSATPKVHSTMSAAADEAERLATLNPGTVYVPVMISGVVQVGGVKWD